MAEEGQPPAMAELRAELAALRPRALNRRAEEAGVDDDALDSAEDSAQIIALIIAKAEQAAADAAQATGAAVAAQEALLREELALLRPRALQRRAEAMGVEEHDLDDAVDMASIIELIVNSPEGPRRAGGGGAPAQGPAGGTPAAALPPEAARFDRNGDGVLDGEEVAEMMRTPQQPAFDAATDMFGDSPPEPEAEAEPAPDPNPDADAEPPEDAALTRTFTAVAEADASVDEEAERQTAAARAMMAGKKLADFVVTEKIGGKDPTAAAGAGYSQSGVCSYVYLAGLRDGDGMQLALKVMLNYEEALAETLAIGAEFDAETALLSDPERLPPHRHIMAVLHSFTDTVSHLPGWDCKCSRSLCVFFR